MAKLKIIECPRDAMQGLAEFIPSPVKIKYLQGLLKVGFDTLDFGSFVSPKAIPQMKDTGEVLAALDPKQSSTDLLCIVANFRGVEMALSKAKIKYLGFPLSVSETFQERNTRRSIAQALEVVQKTQNACETKSKELVVYLSMGFGNPYGDPYSPDILANFSKKLLDMGVKIISIADTVGLARPKEIQTVFENLIPHFPSIEFGAHLHARPDQAKAKIEAAYQGGCRRFDGAIRGLGGCPMAEDRLVGNISTEILLDTLKEEGLEYDQKAFDQMYLEAQEVFSQVY